METTIDTMPAGREMDALVLEKVFGFKWDEKRCRACGGEIVPHPVFPGCWADNCSMRPIPKGDERADAPARYSTDVGAAITILERLRDRVIGITYGCGDPWAVRISRDKNFLATPFEQDASLPLAICRAALKAVGA